MDFSRIIKKLEKIPVENLEVVQYRFGIEALQFQSMAEFETVNRLFKRFNVSIEHHTYTNTYTVFNADDKKHLDTCGKNARELVDIFCLARRTGATQKEARATQYEYAINHNMIEAYDAIYV